MFTVQTKDSPRAKWKPLRFGRSSFPTRELAVEAACRLDQDGCFPWGYVRVIDPTGQDVSPKVGDRT